MATNMQPTKVVADIISLSAQGLPVRAIAEKTGISKTCVNNYQQRLRDVIDAECGEIITTGLAASRKTLVKFAQYGAGPDCVPGQSCEKWAKLSADSAKTIVSLVAGAQPSTVINNLIQINNTPEMTQEIQALQGFMAKMWDNQTIDIGHQGTYSSEMVDIQNAISTNTVDIESGRDTASLAAPHTSPASAEHTAVDNVIDVAQADQSVDNPVDKSSTAQVVGKVDRRKRKKSV